MIKLLIEHGACVNDQNEKGDTPLHLAVANCWSPNNVEVLLNYGADPKGKNNKGKTPKDIAIEKKSASILAIFQNYEDLSELKEPDV